MFGKKYFLLFCNRAGIQSTRQGQKTRQTHHFVYKLHMEQSSVYRQNAWSTSYKELQTKILQANTFHCTRNVSPSFNLTDTFSYPLTADHSYTRQTPTWYCWLKLPHTAEVRNLELFSHTHSYSHFNGKCDFQVEAIIPIISWFSLGHSQHNHSSHKTLQLILSSFRIFIQAMPIQVECLQIIQWDETYPATTIQNFWISRCWDI